MSRRKGWMFFALGLILALSAAAMVFVVLQNAEAKQPVAPPPQQLPPQTQAPQAPIDITPRPVDPVAPPPASSTDQPR